MKVYGSLYYDVESRKWIIPKCEVHISMRIKQVFGSIKKSATPPYAFSNRPSVCADLYWFMTRYPLIMSEEDHTRLKAGADKNTFDINEAERVLTPDYVPRQITLNDGMTPRHYQLTGAEYAYLNKRLIIGDEMGLGKTLTSILTLLQGGDTLPAIVVVQSHLQQQWKDEIEKFTNLKVHKIKKMKPYTLPPADIYIIKYTMLMGWTTVFKEKMYNSAIFDEIQELRVEGTQKYESAKNLSENVDYCIGLSGTIIINYGNEVHTIYNIVKKDVLGNEAEFMRTWTNGSKVVGDPQALGSFLRDERLFLRRTRKEVGRELPPLNTIFHTVGYDDEEIKKVDQLAVSLAIKSVSGSFVQRGQASRELDIMVRKNTGVAKAKEVAAFVKILVESGEPVFLAGWHRDVYDIWLEELKEYNPVMYTGTESQSQKEESKRKFISGESKIMIISLRSGAGMDGLQHVCKMVVIGELDWSPEIMKQLISRIDRDKNGKGEQEQVTVFYLTCDNGSDPPLMDILGLKSSQAHGIINPFGAAPKQHSDKSRLQALAQYYIKKNNIKIVEEITA